MPVQCYSNINIIIDDDNNNNSRRLPKLSLLEKKKKKGNRNRLLGEKKDTNRISRASKEYLPNACQATCSPCWRYSERQQASAALTCQQTKHPVISKARKRRGQDQTNGRKRSLYSLFIHSAWHPQNLSSSSPRVTGYDYLPHPAPHRTRFARPGPGPYHHQK